MTFPENHSLRFDLSNEVHARPPEPLEPTSNITCLALLTPWPYCENDRSVVEDLTPPIRCDTAGKRGETLQRGAE